MISERELCIHLFLSVPEYLDLRLICATRAGMFAGHQSRSIAFVKITDREIRFWFKDKILKRRVNFSYTSEEFVTTLEEHVPDRYQHGVGYFGLLAPRSNASTSAAVVALLRQQKRPCPRKLGWAFLLKRDFGKDPTIDRLGQRMRWAGRLKAGL
jgi:hypothetical protein